MSRSGGTRGRRIVPGTAALLWLLFSSAVRAVDVSGGGSISVTSTDSQGFETEFKEEQASVSLFQDVTPYLNVRFSYQYFDLDSENDAGSEFTRRSREPRFELLYARPRLSARLAIQERTTDSTGRADDFVSESLTASLSWKPSRGPRFQASFRDESNVVDVGVFGEETDSRFLTLETFYDGAWGSAGYSYRWSDLDNASSGFDTTQDRHELRGNTFRSFLDNRVSLDLSTSLSRLERETDTSGEPDIAEPVRAVRGLFAVDTTPTIGELEPAPGLIDGDTETPAPPGIDIGGANTSRNVGVDLGVKSQVTRLQVFVDTVSGPDVLWDVYHSSDNLIWERIGDVVSEYDEALLWYTLHFPETTDRYFKAVNLSANAEPLVRVTEARALLDVDIETGQSVLESTLFRVAAGANFQPGRRVTGRVDVGYSTDEDVAAGLVRRDFEQLHANAGLAAELREDLRLNVGFRYSDSENRREPVLLRTENSYNASLTWTPLSTVDAVLMAQRRDEYEESELLQSSESARLLVAAGLLPDLRVTSDVSIHRTDDPFSGFDRESWEWRESVTAQPTPNWLFGASYRFSSVETTSGEDVVERTDISLTSRWKPTAFLTLGGSWTLGSEDGGGNDRDTVRQSYSLSYNPGPKLTVSGAYQEFETRGLSGTSSDSMSVSYRLNTHMTFAGGLSRSKSEALGETTGDITSLRAVLRFTI